MLIEDVKKYAARFKFMFTHPATEFELEQPGTLICDGYFTVKVSELGPIDEIFLPSAPLDSETRVMTVKDGTAKKIEGGFLLSAGEEIHWVSERVVEMILNREGRVLWPVLKAVNEGQTRAGFL